MFKVITAYWFINVDIFQKISKHIHQLFWHYLRIIKS